MVHEATSTADDTTPAAIDMRYAVDYAEVIIRNERRLNAINVSMWRALRAAFEELSGATGLHCVILRGAGTKAFSAGADISEFETTRSTREQVVRFHEETVGPCLTSIAECPLPVVAAIRGACMGGGLEIASACDIRIADDTARFGAPVGRMGFPLAFAETQGLVRCVGAAVSAELLLEGRILNAREAYEKGLISRFVDVARFDAEVQQAVANISRNAPSANRSHKSQLRRLALDSSPVTPAERMQAYNFADTDEYRAGYRAFLARTKVHNPEQKK